MKNLKRILALFGIIFLLALYLLTLVFAIIDHSESMHLFQAAVFSTVLFPGLFWAYSFIYKLIHKKDENEKDSTSKK